MLSVAASAAVFATPHVFSIRDGPPPCAPCARDAVPAFDRWTIGRERDGLSAASTALLLALGAAAAAAWGTDGAGLRHTAAAVEAAAWAVGTVELGKALAARNRPVLYTADAADAAHDLDSRRSFPSGHAAAAFAVATSLWLDGDRPPATRGAVLGGAALVGVLRVAAARHFPSDVVVGAAMGIASAIVIHEIRF